MTFNLSDFKKCLNEIRQIEDSAPVLVCSPSQEQLFTETFHKENINLKVKTMLHIPKDTVYIMTSSQFNDIFNSEKFIIQKLQDERIRRRYEVYLTEGLFMNMDEAIDAGPPMSFKEFCEKECERD